MKRSRLRASRWTAAPIFVRGSFFQGVPFKRIAALWQPQTEVGPAKRCRASVIFALIVCTSFFVVERSLAAGCSRSFPKSLALSEQDACKILTLAGVSYDRARKALVASAVRGCGPISWSAEYIALHVALHSDVLAIFGNSCTSGVAGSDAAVLEKIQGRWAVLLAVGGANSITATEMSRHGYRYLIVGGPGMCHSIWIWNGRKYVFQKKHCGHGGKATSKATLN